MRIILFVISYCFALSVGVAQQLTLTQPLDGAVYQRDDSGFGTVTIGGTYNSVRFKQFGGRAFIRARLIELNVSDGAVKFGSTPYAITIQRSGTAYSGSIQVPGGWYRIEVEAVRVNREPTTPGGTPILVEEVAETAYSKVGIGEVFIIGGQSNAQGLPNEPGDLNVAQTNLDYDGVRMQPVNVGPDANLPRTFYNTVTANSISQVKADYVQNTARASQLPTN